MLFYFFFGKLVALLKQAVLPSRISTQHPIVKSCCYVQKASLCILHHISRWFLHLAEKFSKFSNLEHFCVGPYIKNFLCVCVCCSGWRVGEYFFIELFFDIVNWKNAQCESSELSSIGGKKRTIAQEAASETAWRKCSA